MPSIRSGSEDDVLAVHLERKGKVGSGDQGNVVLCRGSVGKLEGKEELAIDSRSTDVRGYR